MTVTEALKIIRELALGIDPITGEAVSSGSMRRVFAATAQPQCADGCGDVL